MVAYQPTMGAICKFLSHVVLGVKRESLVLVEEKC